MRLVLLIAVTAAAVSGVSHMASAVPAHCVRIFEQCMEKNPFNTAAHCVRAEKKCDWDARHARPDAITGAGPRAPKGDRPGKRPIYGPENRTLPAETSTTSSGSAATSVWKNSPLAAPRDTTPAQLAERLRRLQQQQQR
jgi:hypothetical protein